MDKIININAGAMYVDRIDNQTVNNFNAPVNNYSAPASNHPVDALRGHAFSRGLASFGGRCGTGTAVGNCGGAGAHARR